MPANPEIHIVEVQKGQAYLESDQNFADQEPFLSMKKVIPADFFVDSFDPRGLAGVVRLALPWVGKEVPASAINSQDYLLLRPYLRAKVDSGMITILRTFSRIIADTPYLPEYCNHYFHSNKSVFARDDEPRPEITKEVETFITYQRRMLKADRLFQAIGLEDELPGLSLPSDVTEILHSGKRPVNARFRFLTYSESLK